MLADNIFLKIINKQIPAKVAYEDDRCLAFHDVNPQAPVHLLIVPRQVIPTTDDLTEADEATVGHLHVVAARVPANFRYYVGTGSRHTMYGNDKVYSDVTGGVPPLVDWIEAMLGGTPDWTNVECQDCGVTLPGDPKPNPLPQPPFDENGNIVCSAP